MKLNLIENAYILPAIYPSAPFSAGVENGVVTDRVCFHDAILGVAVGAATGTPTSFTVDVKVQTGDESNGSDMADYEDVDGNVYNISTLLADNTYTFKNIVLEGAKKYIRIVLTVAFVGGTDPTIPVSVNFVLGDSTYSSKIPS